LEETDTFALYDNDINIKIVTHNCFPAGTRILLNDGTYKNIEDLTTTDVLLTYNNEQGKYGAGTATSIRVSTQNELIYIVTENGDEVKSTPLHKFYVEEHGWSHAQDIKVGNLLFNKDGILVKVKSIESLKGEFKVYHLIDVKDNHTYFAENILVHNKVTTTTSCFTAETKVEMEDGSFKNIIDIEIGDCILSYKDGKYVRGVVTDKLIHPTNDVVEVVKYKGMISDRLHPFYDNGEWKPIFEAPGVELGIQYVDNFYNLEIDGNLLFESEHNFIVEDFVVSGLGDNELLNNTLKRQAVFQ
jgi:intein/homing endonuclease